MSKMKNIIINEDMVEWAREWSTSNGFSLLVGDWVLTEEGNICEYTEWQQGFLKLTCVVSNFPKDIGRTYLYEMSRLTKVPKGSTLLAAKALYGK